MRSMDYKRHYDTLCTTRKALNRAKGGCEYYEEHHIVPRSLGGSDSDKNLVLLTAKEHYLAHLLLFVHYKTIGGDSLRKMAFAVISMSSGNSNHKRSGIREYALYREAAILCSLGRKVEDTTNYRKPKSDKHKEAIRSARLNSPRRSQETRVKIALTKKGIVTPIMKDKVACPHCDVVGQDRAMRRWHFNNCKMNTNAELA
jgi:hypothetical protein